MRGGQLRDRCRFERPVRLDDEYGNAYDGWALVSTVRGDLRPTPGRESVVAGRLEPTSTGTLRVQASPFTNGIDATHRVLITRKGRTTTYQIKGQPLDLDRTGREIEFLVEGGVAT
jgi:head-tail adaptor